MPQYKCRGGWSPLIEEIAIKCKGGKGGKAAEHPGHQEDAEVGGDRIAKDHETGKDAHEQAADDIHGERAPWKFRSKQAKGDGSDKIARG